MGYKWCVMLLVFIALNSCDRGGNVSNEIYFVSCQPGIPCGPQFMCLRENLDDEAGICRPIADGCQPDIDSDTAHAGNCPEGVKIDCEEGNPSIPGGAELCDLQGLDDNCNGSVDEGCGCQILGEQQVCDFNGCAGTVTCIGGSWSECEPLSTGPEICGNLIDEDCDGRLNTGCACESDTLTQSYAHGQPKPCGYLCEGTQLCEHGRWLSCEHPEAGGGCTLNGLCACYHFPGSDECDDPPCVTPSQI